MLAPWVRVHLLTGVFLMLLVVWVWLLTTSKKIHSAVSAAITPGHTHLELLHT